MEYKKVLLNGSEIMKNTRSCIRKCVNYKKILDGNIKTLKCKIEELRKREEEIDRESKYPQALVGKNKEREVEIWLKNVQHKRNEVDKHIEQKDKTRYISRLQFLRLVEKNIQEVTELIEKGRFPGGLLIDVHEDLERPLIPTPLVGQSMTKRFTNIWECLMNDEIKSIGVYGMRGIGKTAIVTYIHNHLLESPHTFAHVYWVTVAKESNIHKLQDDIAKVMELDLSDEQDEKKRGAKLIKELERREKFVLILDDMWKAFPPEEIGIPIGVNAGKLIVTTRSLEVCRMMGCQKNIKVEPLLVEEAWDLFREKLGHETRLAPKVEKFAKSITKECAGLPLAIITTAGSMRGVHKINEWRNALNELREPTKGLIDTESKLFKLLKFNYDRLNDEKLQQCLLYCALFPKDYKIQREYLIGCWIAEGLVDEKETRREEFNRGHALLFKLLENAFLLEHSRDFNGKICVKMHDVIRDMALSITRENPQFMVKAGVQLLELPDERDWSENLERVSLMHNNLKGQIPPISPKCSKLRTLMLQSNRNIKEIPNSVFVYMQNLRFLDLSYLGIERLPDSILNLEELRALILKNCQNLRYVSSLEKLTKLRELDLRYTAIEELPHGMEKLVKLKRLDLFYYPRVAYVFPRGVLLCLSHLHSLSLVPLKITDDVRVDEINSLRQLEVLVVRFYSLLLFNSYVKTQHWRRLSHYSLQLVHRRDVVFENVCCREVHMNDCNLIGGAEGPLILPSNIQELCLKSCNDLTSLSDISSSLKNARELERCWIAWCQGIEHLWHYDTNTSLLRSLRTLMLFNLRNLSDFFKFKGVGIVVGGAPPKCKTFSNLRLFSVGNCPNLKYVFTRGLVQHHLQNLETIHAYTCDEMEEIILAEKEENEEEIIAAKEEEEKKNSSITCPKLKSLELHDLPKLKSVWRGTMVCHSIQIEVRRCPMLKRLPLFLQLTDDSQASTIAVAVTKISGEQDWWDLLEWDSEDPDFQPLFDNKQKKSSSLGHSRACMHWRKDAQRYDKLKGTQL